jgi:hypothetical protein
VFKSDSNPKTTYQTLQYTDGSTSCECKGWTRRVAADGSRSCKHTRSVDMGQADRECVSSNDYTSKAIPQNVKMSAVKASIAEKNTQPKANEPAKTRRFDWDD